jgi:multicomponent Na+:H+ antiporter subunit A
LLQNGVLGWYLLVTIGTTVALAGYALVTRVGAVPLPGEPVRLGEAAVVLAIVAGALAMVRASSLLVAVAALGVVGYGVAVVFLLFGGPDLALTQFAIETLSVLLFVLVLRRLPPLRALSPRWERARDGLLAVLGGALMTALVLAATAAPHPAPLRDYFARASLALANGRNVVNVILVDFRALDTLGEITVLALAALGVVALLGLRASGRREAA